MSSNYEIETTRGIGNVIIVSNYPTLNKVLMCRYNRDYKPFIDQFAIGVWKIKK
jgi:hypothetical protein